MTSKDEQLKRVFSYPNCSRSEAVFPFLFLLPFQDEPPALVQNFYKYHGVLFDLASCQIIYHILSFASSVRHLRLRIPIISIDLHARTLAIAMDPLTPIIVLKTEVPALEFDLVPSSGKEHPELLPYPSKERRVTVNVCSEYMEYSAPVGVIQTGSDLGILQDENGQPMVFALSGDEDGSRLICLIRVNGGPISWQRFDISPVIPGEGKHINCFSISPGSNGNAYIAASVMNLDETCDVYHAMIDVPNVTWNDDENRISGFEPRG